jgi:uncharacterized ion transporter superfamily protein YfcC
MSSGALVAIGITALICAFGFGTSAVNPGALAKSSTFFYSGTVFSLVLAVSCFVPVIQKTKQTRYSYKHKIQRKKTTTYTTKQNKNTPGDWRSNLGNFDLGRLTLAGWVLSLLSLIVFLTVVGIATSSLEDAGVKQASRGDIKVLGTISLGITVAFFLASKWTLEKFNINLFKD